jgi:hypothetical protein
MKCHEMYPQTPARTIAPIETQQQVSTFSLLLKYNIDMCKKQFFLNMLMTFHSIDPLKYGANPYEKQ